jgi:hypothetical protein
MPHASFLHDISTRQYTKGKYVQYFAYIAVFLRRSRRRTLAPRGAKDKMTVSPTVQPARLGAARRHAFLQGRKWDSYSEAVVNIASLLHQKCVVRDALPA